MVVEPEALMRREDITRKYGERKTEVKLQVPKGISGTDGEDDMEMEIDGMVISWSEMMEWYHHIIPSILLVGGMTQIQVSTGRGGPPREEVDPIRIKMPANCRRGDKSEYFGRMFSSPSSHRSTFVASIATTLANASYR